MDRDAGRPLKALRSWSGRCRLRFALGRWLQFGKPDGSWVKTGRRAVAVGFVRDACTFLGLKLLALLDFCVVLKVGGNSGVDIVLSSVVVLDQPGGAVPGSASDRLFDKGSQHSFGEDSAVAPDVLIGEDGLVLGSLDINKISSGRPRVGAIGKRPWSKGGLVANQAMRPLSAHQCHRHLLTGVVVVFELVKDLINEVIESRDDLELDFVQNRALEGLGKRRLDFLASCKLFAPVSRRLRIVGESTYLALKGLEEGQARMARDLVVESTLYRSGEWKGHDADRRQVGRTCL